MSVPSLELGPPLPQGSVSPPRKQGGGDTRLRVRGWGSLNSNDWRKSTLPTLWVISLIGRTCCIVNSRDVKDGYPELLGLADAAVRVDVGYVDGGVPLVASDPTANAHAQ